MQQRALESRQKQLYLYISQRRRSWLLRKLSVHRQYQTVWKHRGEIQL
jgi:hypothetical protein